MTPTPSESISAVRLVAAEMAKREADGKKWIQSHPVTVKEVKCAPGTCSTCDMQAGCLYRELVANSERNANPGLVLPTHWQGQIKDTSAMVRLYAHIRALQRAAMRVQLLDQLVTRDEGRRKDDEESAGVIVEMGEALSRYETARAALEMAEARMG